MISPGINISTLCTFNDWAAHYGAWGESGVNRVFDFLSIARIKRVYWRGLSGGMAEYPSKVAPVWIGRENSTMYGFDTKHGGVESWHCWKGSNFDQFDALKLAVKIGRERGIEVCAWMTIYEEDHGGSCRSSLGSDPKFIQMDREGRKFHGTVDFFYPEVREYKLKIVRELMDYGVSGLLLDFARHDATPSADRNGVHRFGYNEDIRRDFKREHGVDPQEIPADDSRWLKYKNGYQTDFVAEVFRLVGPKKLKAIMAWPVDCYRWLCLDVMRLSREKQLDFLFPFSMKYNISPGEIVGSHRLMKKQVSARHTKVGTSIQSYFGIDGWDVEHTAEAARKAGISEILHSECDQMIVDRLTTSFRAIHLGCPRWKREVKVKRITHAPTEKDWSRQRTYTGKFLVATGPDRLESKWQTKFKVLSSPQAFHCRMYAWGDAKAAKKKSGDVIYDQYADRDAEFFEIRKHYIDALGARLYWLGRDRGHLFLDPEHSSRKFFHFVTGRDGTKVQQTHLDNSWKGNWSGRVLQSDAKLWIAEWTIPYRTLGQSPKKGSRWTFQLMRETAEEREVSSWFATTTPSCSGVMPYEWGDVVFE